MKSDGLKMYQDAHLKLHTIDRDGCSILRQSITMLSPNLLMAHGQNYQCCIAIRTASVPRVRARLLDIGG